MRSHIPEYTSPLLAVLLLLGCGASDGARFESPTAPFSPAADLSGAWVGSYTSLADGMDQLADETFPAAATIEQRGTNVTARLGVGVSSDTNFYTFVGVVGGTRLSGTINGFKATGRLEGGQLTISWGYNRWDLHR